MTMIGGKALVRVSRIRSTTIRFRNKEWVMVIDIPVHEANSCHHRRQEEQGFAIINQRSQAHVVVRARVLYRKQPCKANNDTVHNGRHIG